jgi:hypothetical protein
MRTNHGSRRLDFVIAMLLVIALSAPAAVNAEDQVLALAPAPGSSWDETSGYAAVERARAEAGTLMSGEAGRGAEDAVDLAAAARLWDETSGYGAVEASRAANAMPVAP